jgi:hypothetical protein
LPGPGGLVRLVSEVQSLDGFRVGSKGCEVTGWSSEKLRLWESSASQLRARREILLNFAGVQCPIIDRDQVELA